MRRDDRWVEREYGREKWPAVVRTIGERDDSLPRAIVRVDAADDVVRPTAFAGHLVEVPARLAVSAYRGWVAQTVASYASGVDAVIELGAGWGRNLFGTYLSGGNEDALYIAAEYTEAGRDAASLLAAREPTLRFRAAPFDSHRPALDAPRLDSAVVLTAHAVEQIPELDESVVGFIAGLAGEVTVLHFEPVGFQIRGEDPSYAEAHDYNRNLWQLLTDTGARVERVETDVIGLNPPNPTSLIVWRPDGT